MTSQTVTWLGTLLLVGTIGFPLVASTQEPNDDAHAEHVGEDAHDEEAIQLSAEVLEEFGVEVATAGPAVLLRTVSLPAEVRPNQNLLAHIAPRFPGVATEVRSEVGDLVKAGDTLAVIEASQSLSPYSVKTLIGGVVIERHVTRGEPVSQDRGALFTVADLSTVWIDLSVYQRHLPELSLGQRVVVSAGHGLEEAEGTLSYVAPVIHEQTRTATARVVLKNADGHWRPGMFVTARVEVGRDEVAIGVPRSAVASVDGQPTVFVQDDDGFEPRVVQVGREGEHTIEIRSGLAVGDRFVARGAFTLKSELAREELSGGHSH